MKKIYKKFNNNQIKEYQNTVNNILNHLTEI